MSVANGVSRMLKSFNFSLSVNSGHTSAMSAGSKYETTFLIVVFLREVSNSFISGSMTRIEEFTLKCSKVNSD